MADKITVYNHDVVGLTNRINRFIIEVQKSSSSGVSEMSRFDQDRLASYLDSMDAYHAWVIGQPELDLPETNPRSWEYEDFPGIIDVENEEVNDVVRLFILTRDELVSSQSARRGSGFVGFDSLRLTAIIEKARLFLTTYIAEVTPLDLPESSPLEALSGPGSTGT